MGELYEPLPEAFKSPNGTELEAVLPAQHTYTGEDETDNVEGETKGVCPRGGPPRPVRSSVSVGIRIHVRISRG